MVSVGHDEEIEVAVAIRREGDLRNAGYWYKRADRPECTAPLGEEWNEIVTALLR